MKSKFLILSLLSLGYFSTSAQLIPNGIYYIFPKGTEAFRIDNAANQGNDGNNIQIWENNDTPAQQWKVENAKNGTIVIHCMNNESKVIDNEGFNPRNDNNISIYQDNRTPNQLWIPEKAGSCFVLRTSQNPKYVLSRGEEPVHNGQNIRLYEYMNTDGQKWNFVPVSADAASEEFKSGLMTGYLGSMNIEMQITLIPDAGNADKGKVKGWFQDTLNPGKEEFSGTYTGDLMDCNIKVTYISDGTKCSFHGDYTIGRLPGIGETFSFGGMWTTDAGTELDFEVSNM